MQQGGSQYRRLIGAFQRVFGATIFFGTDIHRSISPVVHEARFNFMSEARIWYSRESAIVAYQGVAPGFAGLDQLNLIVAPGLPPGDQPAFVTINGVPSNAGVITVN